ncbi:hypothetical protein KEJ33_06280 [Candidatus Bathyarchaeota archaeon]|nr:hypothetical protein [Candidatus Bathyarchaeota archaeon]
MARNTTKLVGAAVLAPLSVLLQGLPPMFLTPWFMRIDFAAVPWVVCWIVFGWRSALLCLLISAPLVGFLGPFAGGIVGAVMKSVASVWMFIVPALFADKLRGFQNLFRRRVWLLVACASAIMARVLCTLFFNLYFALPVFFKMDYATIIAFFSNPLFQSFVSINLGMVGLERIEKSPISSSST